MAEMTRRDQELQGLFELRNNLNALKRKKKEYDEICEEQEMAKLAVAEEAERKTRWLPVDHAEKYRENLCDKYYHRTDRKKRAIKVSLFFGIMLLGALMYVLYKPFYDLFSVIIMTIVPVLAVAVLGCTVSTYDNANDVIIVLLVIPFLFILLAAGYLLVNCQFIWGVVLSIIMIILLIVCRTSLKKCMVCSASSQFSTNEKKILKEKETLDAKNKKENADRYAVIFLQETNKAATKLQSIEKRRVQSEAEVKSLEVKIKNNGFLGGDDIQWMDQVIHYIQSRRADSIKEALRLVDMEQERARQRKLDEQRHKEIMEELEYQSWEAANARAEQREAAERAEKALRDSEAAAERARYEDEMRRYESEQRIKQELLNLEIERNRR